MAKSKESEKIIRFYKGTDNEEIAIKLVDMAEQVNRTAKFRVSEFLTPIGQEIAETVAANYPGLRVDFSGGYNGAERQQALLVDESFMGNPTWDLAVVKLGWNGKFVHKSHRDVLGAIMSLGIERDNLGDILMAGDEARVITNSKMAQLLLQEVPTINGAEMTCVMDELENIPAKEEKYKELRATIASMRIDAVIAAGYGISRSRAVTDIEADKAKLNWQNVKNASQSVKEGDVISLRGRGRLEVAELRGETKKGRIAVLLKRYY